MALAFMSTRDALVSAVHSSYQNKRYRAVDLFSKLGAAAISSGVVFVPFLSRRIINVGKSGKHFVFQYAGKVRMTRIRPHRYRSSVCYNLVPVAGRVHCGGYQAHDRATRDHI